MKYLTEYRDGTKAKKLAEQIAQITTKQWRIMEVCGGQTHSVMRYGIDQLLPDSIELIHGPGCPVCVTPIEVIDLALAIASRPNIIFCSYGDMLRVPGSRQDLFQVKASGADIRVVYSPLDALSLARQNPQHEVVFLAIGFETTAPANAMAIKLAQEQNVENFSAIVSHVLVPPAVRSILNTPESKIHGILAAGHVCSVMGLSDYPEICQQFGVPIVVTGFEPLDILEGIRRTILQLETGNAQLLNAYSRAVSDAGNSLAKKVIEEVFEVADQNWRGIGVIPGSGWQLRDAYRDQDARHRFKELETSSVQPDECRAGEVLQGLIKPTHCEAFGTRCTPEHPLGAPMVSSEGACAAYFQYRSHSDSS